jgi:hypothetical protein
MFQGPVVMVETYQKAAPIWLPYHPNPRLVSRSKRTNSHIYNGQGRTYTLAGLKVNLEGRGSQHESTVERVGSQGETRPGGPGESHTISRIVEEMLAVFTEKRVRKGDGRRETRGRWGREEERGPGEGRERKRKTKGSRAVREAKKWERINNNQHPLWAA